VVEVEDVIVEDVIVEDVIVEEIGLEVGPTGVAEEPLPIV
jgi:hypothetical protein